MSVTFLSVTLDLRYFVPALLLLWFPRQWLRVGPVGRRVRGQRARDWSPSRERSPGDMSVWLNEEIVKPRNWVDFFRSLAGGAAVGGTLFSGVMAISPALAKPDGLTLQIIFGLKVLVLLLGLAVQTFRVETRLSLFAPIFFVQGLAFGLIGFKSALVAIVLAWVVNALLPSVAVMLAVFGFLEVCVGTFFGQPRREVLLAGGLSLLPVIVSFLLKRRLAQFTKKTKIIAGPSTSAR